MSEILPRVTSITSPPTTPRRTVKRPNLPESSRVRVRWFFRVLMTLVLLAVLVGGKMWLKRNASVPTVQNSSSIQQQLDDFAEVLMSRIEAASSRPVIYMGSNILMCYVSAIGRHLFVSSLDHGMTPHLCAGRGWEGETTMALQRLVQPGMSVIDVGSNVGWFTFLFANWVGKGGRVLALEAQPATYRLLAWSLEIAGYNQGWNRPDRKPASIAQGDVTAVNVAAFDNDNASLRITFDPERPLNNHLDILGEKTAPSSTSVSGMMIATLAETYLNGKVDLIKIDVEGAEAQAYAGMRALFKNNPNIVVVMEVNTYRSKTKSVDPQPFYKTIYSDFKIVKEIGDNGHLYDISIDELMATEQAREDVMLVLRNK